MIRNIINSGVNESFSLQERRGVILSNSIGLILGFIVIILFIVRNLILGQEDQLLVRTMVSLLIALGPIILNRLSLTVLARLVLCYLPILDIWQEFYQANLSLGPDASLYTGGLRLYFVAFGALPYLLFSINRPLFLVLGVLPTMISILFFGNISVWLGAQISEISEISDPGSLQHMRGVVSFIVVSAACFGFQFIIYSSDSVRQQMMADLESQTHKIANQNEELKVGQEKLTEINLHLEELVGKKSSDILRQNEVLKKYAYSNAHHVRGSVARILGLIELTKMKTGIDFDWFFKTINSEVEEMDKVVRGISEELGDSNMKDDDFIEN